MAAEKVAHAFALAQAVDHRVETTLQLTEFGAVEHHQIPSQIPLLDTLERSAHHSHRRRRQPSKNPHQKEPADQRCRRHDQHTVCELDVGEVLQHHLKDP
ncbi:Uncharacterised protein [Mycobacterium tuberculosis]|nr:Uncharacterised protein [Mycobacterium tuberculosis]